MTRVSVAMVTYNGENYVREQIETILKAMGEQDELIISDDGSTDSTGKILAEFDAQDERIRLLKGPGCGVKRNVDHVLRECSGKYIFLADQDDIWKPEKIERVWQTFAQEGCDLVVHDAVVCGEDTDTVLLESFYSVKDSGCGAVKNIWRNTYMGCCMAFRRDLLEKVLPIPDSIEMHDQWIGVLADVSGAKVCFIPDKLIYYRRHGNNESSLKHYGIGRMISNRVHFLRALHERRKELQM